jgi:Holliday junction resolvase-like predicted endonuclease
VWAILQATAAHLKKFQEECAAQREKDQAAYEQRQKEYQAAYEQRQKEYQAAYEQRQKEYDARREKAATDMEKRLTKLTKEVGGMSKNNGAFAEEYFYNALDASRSFGNIKYDAVDRNMMNKIGKKEGEFDVVMLNGSSVAIIEVKYRVHQKFPEKLATKKVKRFRKLYPKYAQHKIYLGIAGLSFTDAVVANARLFGIGLVKPKGDTIECDTEHIRAY